MTSFILQSVLVTALRPMCHLRGWGRVSRELDEETALVGQACGLTPALTVAVRSLPRHMLPCSRRLQFPRLICEAWVVPSGSMMGDYYLHRKPGLVLVCKFEYPFTGRGVLPSLRIQFNR